VSESRNGLDRELNGLLLRDRNIAAVAHLIGVGLVFLLVWDSLPLSVFAPWAATVLFAVIFRAVAWGRADRLSSSSSAVAITARVTMTVLGLAWGVGAAVAAQYISLASFALLLMILAGLVSGGIATLAADRWVFPLYAVAMLGAVLVGVAAVTHSRFEAAAIALIVVFAAFNVRQHRQAHTMLVERLRAEARARLNERRLAEAQATAHVGSWEWDIPSDRVTWSEELHRLFGLPPTSLPSYQSFMDRVHPDDRQRVEQVIAQGLAERRAVEYDYRVVRPDGTVRHVHGINIVVLNEAGTPRGLAGTSLDVTDRKRAEQSLAASETYHRALIEEALDLTTLVDADGFVRYASPSYQSVLGYQPEQVIGQRVFDFVHPEDLAATLAIFADGSTTPQATRAHEFRFRHNDGSWRVIAAVGRNLFDDPVIHAAIINGRDVTAQKATEEHERTLLRELQRAIGEVKMLKGILPICASCKRIKNEGGGWEAVESYVREHTNAEFSHGLCPDCAARDWGTTPRSA